MIKPTVGRVVWFWRYGEATTGYPPEAALITQVWSSGLVNLVVFNQEGASRGETSVDLIADPNEKRNHRSASWMPYQLGQAAKTEELERKAVANTPAPFPSIVPQEFTFNPSNAASRASAFEMICMGILDRRDAAGVPIRVDLETLMRAYDAAEEPGILCGTGETKHVLISGS